MESNQELGGAFLQKLAVIKKQKGSINIDDIGTVLGQIASGADHKKYENIIEEISRLSAFMEQMKHELAVIGADYKTNNSAEGAALHLEAVIQNTEEASHKIIDAVSAIGEIAGKAGGATKSGIDAEVTKIYEACSFQDLTAQRIKKVIKIMDGVSERISRMQQMFGQPQVVVAAPPVKANDDSALLNGPQLPDEAPSQDDIDALFSKL